LALECSSYSASSLPCVCAVTLARMINAEPSNAILHGVTKKGCLMLLIKITGK